MNKKGYVVTYLPFKKYLILVLIGVALFLLYYFFVMKSAGLVSIKKSCPDGVIPERFYLNHYNSAWDINVKDYFNPTEYETKWEDGTLIPRETCRLGKEDGENVNYLYCLNLPYSNTPINPDGTIGKKINLYIDLVLNPNDNTIVEQDFSNIGRIIINISSIKIVDYRCDTSGY